MDKSKQNRAARTGNGLAAFLKYAGWAGAALTAGVLAYTFIDKRLAYYFEPLPLEKKKTLDWAGSLTSPEFALGAGGLLLALGAYQHQVKRQPVQQLIPFGYVPASVVLAYLLKKSLKYLVSRKRPLVLFVEHDFGFRWGASGEKLEQSFPSGHAISVFALAHSSARSWPDYAVPVYTAAGLLLFTRVTVNDHFLSDLIAGAWVGSMVPELLYTGFFKRLAPSEK